MVIEDNSGNKVGFYRESHTLVIGVSDYTARWPDLESIPGEIAKVQSALEAQGFDIESITDPDSETLKRGFEKFINRYGFDKDNRLLFFFQVMVIRGKTKAILCLRTRLIRVRMKKALPGKLLKWHRL